MCKGAHTKHQRKKKNIRWGIYLNKRLVWYLGKKLSKYVIKLFVINSRWYMVHHTIRYPMFLRLYSIDTGFSKVRFFTSFLEVFTDILKDRSSHSPSSCSTDPPVSYLLPWTRHQSFSPLQSHFKLPVHPVDTLPWRTLYVTSQGSNPKSRYAPQSTVNLDPLYYVSFSTVLRLQQFSSRTNTRKILERSRTSLLH